jgi:prepilin-type N-terminal cleavage/methylation domain-containing protein
MKSNSSRGFTLIELLVVIAIIGILSAVVLASLNTARSKGNDAAIQSDLSTIQTQAEIFYGTGNTYGAAQNLCTGAVFADPTITKAIAGAVTASGGTAAVCNNSTSAYAVAVKLHEHRLPGLYLVVFKTEPSPAPFPKRGGTVSAMMHSCLSRL